MHNRQFAAVVIGVFALVSNLAAQEAQFKFKKLDLADGLSHPDIWTIFKDSRGFVWIGTAFGVNRFDGYTIKSFLHDPQDSTSLSGDGVYRIFETPEKKMMIRTSAGLTLYDPDTESFKLKPHDFFNQYGVSESLSGIAKDSDGSYWFVEPTKLIRYSPQEKRSIVIQNDPSDSNSISRDDITDFTIDRYNNHWLVHSNGVVEKIEIQDQQGRVVRRILDLHHRDRSSRMVYQILSDAKGDLWFCTPGRSQGVFIFRVKQNRLESITVNSAPMRLNTNAVSSILEDTNGLIWVATDHGGINIVDDTRKTVSYVTHRDGEQTSLAANSISCLYRDDQGIIWSGAYKRGVSYYHPNIYQFDVYKHYSTDPSSLPFEDINRFAEDRKGNLWIGTNGGGLIYFDRQNGKFTQYLNEPDNLNSLSGNVIVSLCMDSENNLWIGTYKEGLNKFDGKKFTRFKHVPADTSSLPSQNVWEIFEDSKKRLWIGTLEAGVSLLDRSTGKFQRVGTSGPNRFSSLTIEIIEEDRHGNIWVGTIAGLDILSADGKMITHYAPSEKPNSLSNISVSDILKDSKGRMWVGTFDGLNLFDESISGFRIFKDNNTRHSVLSIEEDNSGNIWMTKMDGLTKITFANGALDSVSFKHYTESDGLQGRQFNLNAGIKTKRGELVFGGPTGFNISDGMNHQATLPITKIVFSELELYEKPVAIGEEIDGVVVLDGSIAEVKEIVLPPNKHFFSLKFSALNYFNPERDQYEYMLEGLNTGWLPVDSKTHQIVFNRLSPGHYVLRVKAANSDGVWGKNEAVLAIVIQPPFWKTQTAFVIYGCLVIIVLMATRKVIQQREKMKFAIEQERLEMQRLHELDMMKVKFFTNVSHEFRTPLTLILTPIERLIRKAADPEQLALFNLVHRNGRRLMNLVNQLLDFKKLEVHEIKFNPTRGDIIAYVKDTVLTFSDISEKKSVKLNFHSTIDRLDVMFDHDKLEKILFNLLSNAFKFTMEGGVVSVKCDRLQEGEEHFLRIEVGDTGIGIPQDKLEKIFEPFFQTDIPKSIVNQGSGIGLSITKEFVKIHGGRIHVTSDVGQGSLFSVWLPIKEVSGEQDPLPIERGEDRTFEERQLLDADATIAPEANANLETTAKNKSLLLVDDNDDFRFYLRDNLKFTYTIYEARNGAEAWNLILSVLPDLVVSDVMMPELNGIDLCTKVKSDERVSHIPVILLTARSSEEQRVEGFKTGADDYITKPFNFEVLQARIVNLLKQREKFQKSFRKTLDIKSSELQITPLDVKFIDNAVKVVEAHIAVPEFSIEDLGLELGISRAYVFKKILALTGKTPLEFIRTIRLQHAAQLLEKSQLSIREVAYKVGFNNPKYFTKYFKEHYGMLPSDYAASKKKTE